MVKVIAGGVATGALLWLAARADQASPQATTWTIATDLAVGIAFVLAGTVAGGSTWQRRLVAAVGVAWLLGSVTPLAQPAHQAVLIVALTSFPSGRIRGRPAWLIVLAAAVVLLGVVPQLVTVGLVLLTGLLCLRSSHATWYPSSVAVAVAATLGVSWLVPRVPSLLNPDMALLAYEIVLILVAGAFPMAARSAVESRRRLADEVLSAGNLAGLDGLAAVLADTLDDPDLRLHRWLDSAKGYVDARGSAYRLTGQELEVEDADGPVAVVEHDAPALLDPPIARAVQAAVRLTVVNLRLQEVQNTRLGELRAARARVIAASDDQREMIAADLRQNVVVLLTQARSELSAAGREASGAAATLAMVDDSLVTAIQEIDDLVAGIPPARLGDGLLEAALRGFAGRSPLKVTLDYDHAADADPAVEAALYYVCSEALANIVKHAGVDRATIVVRRQDGAAQMVISDEGRGGADPTGSGLTGLQDRLAAYSGRLQVVSPPGAGTTLTATVPFSRSSSTA